ncbi:hypothetical protein Holit_00893 [Hollandina sp. SP2]
MNITTSHFDIPRYRDNQDLKNFYRQFGLDGVEVMEGAVKSQHIIFKEDVIGVHLTFSPVGSVSGGGMSRPFLMNMAPGRSAGRYTAGTRGRRSLKRTRKTWFLPTGFHLNIWCFMYPMFPPGKRLLVATGSILMRRSWTLPLN